MLFKGTTSRSARDIAQTIDSIGGQLDAFTAKEYASYYIKVLDEHLAARDRSAERHGHASGARARRRRERAGRDPRRDQDGRGRARRSRARGLRAAVLVAASARPADSRHAGDGRLVRVRRPARVLRRAPTSRRISSSRRRATSSTRSSRDLVERAFAESRVERRVERTDAAGGHAGRRRARTRTSSRATCASARRAYPQAHDDRHALYVLNTILGGSMSSRLFQHIREERGLAYAVFSNLTTYTRRRHDHDLRRLRRGQGRTKSSR